MVMLDKSALITAEKQKKSFDFTYLICSLQYKHQTTACNLKVIWRELICAVMCSISMLLTSYLWAVLASFANLIKQYFFI